MKFCNYCGLELVPEYQSQHAFLIDIIIRKKIIVAVTIQIITTKLIFAVINDIYFKAVSKEISSPFINNS